MVVDNFLRCSMSPILGDKSSPAQGLDSSRTCSDLTRRSEVSLAHLRNDCKLRVHNVRNLVLHAFSKQQVGAPFIEPVTLHEPAHQLRRRVLQSFIERARTTEGHDEVLVFEAR